MSSTRPLVSVIIPTRNRAALLAEALRSVYAQDGRRVVFDLEVVVVDDASTDATGEVVRGFPDARYVRFDTRVGACGARNKGLQLCSGEYVAFLDDDDLWLPNKTLAQMTVLREEPAVGVVYAQNDIEAPWGRSIWPNPVLAPSGWVCQTFLMDDFVSIDTVLVRRTVLEGVRGFDESLATLEHYDWFLRLARRVPFRFIPQPVAVCRLSTNGRWLSSVATGMYREELPRVVERTLATLPEGALTRDVVDRVRASIFARIVYHEGAARPPREVRMYIERALAASPELLFQPIVCDVLRWHARKLVARREVPEQEVAALCQAVVSIAGSKAARQPKVRSLLGEMQLAASAATRARGGRRLWKGAGAALMAVRWDARTVVRAAGRAVRSKLVCRKRPDGTATAHAVPIHPGIALSVVRAPYMGVQGEVQQLLLPGGPSAVRRG